MKKLIVCGGFLFIVFWACAARADEIADLKKQLSDMQVRLEQLESQQSQEKKVIAEEVNKAVDKKQISAVPDSMKWVENMKISGDFRYRYEGIDSQTNGKWNQSAQRNRIRARIGIYDKVNEDVDLGFRIGSGSADPSSTNQTLGDSFDKKPIWLDQAYFDWHPKDVKGLDIIGGKMPKPFYRVGDNQLIWDDDLNPEGVAAKYEMPLSDSLKAYINGGGFWVQQRETSNKPSTSLWAVQSYLKNAFEDKSYLLGGMSFFGYGNIRDENDLQTVWKGKANSFGNTLTSSNNFKYKFDVVEGFAEYGFKLADYPVSVFGDVARNADAPSNKSYAWLIGTIFNRAKDPGSWQIGYNYRDIDSDAVVGQFNDSDFDGGGTNAKGHCFNFTYQLAKNFQTGLTYFLDEKKNDDHDKYRRLQADVIFKF